MSSAGQDKAKPATKPGPQETSGPQKTSEKTDIPEHPDTEPPDTSAPGDSAVPADEAEPEENSPSADDAEPEENSTSADDTELETIPERPGDAGAVEGSEPPGDPAPAAEAEDAAEEPDASDDPRATAVADDAEPGERPPVPDAAVAETLAQPEPELSAERSGADAGRLAASELLGALTSLVALGSRVDDIATAAAELARLRSRDTDLIARLHEDVTRLRTGEIAAALNPVVTGMIKLHDQMVSLGALSDPAGPVGMLHTQLVQVLELTCAVRPFTPEPGERFDASRHTGTRRVPASDTAADGTIARAVRAGFVRADGSVVRVAEVEVHRGSG